MQTLKFRLKFGSQRINQFLLIIETLKVGLGVNV